MSSNEYIDSNGQLEEPLGPAFHRNEGFREYSSSSGSRSNDVTYENLSAYLGRPSLSLSNDVTNENLAAYLGRPSHLNPNLVSGNIGSPIMINNMNSGPYVGPNSLVTDSTSLMSDGANFQRTGSFNIDSYQNFPSSPLSFSSSNRSALAIEGASSSQLNASHLNQIDQATRGKRLLHMDIPSSVFAGKNLELLSYLPQISKKPRLDPYAESALNQLIFQQFLQKQESVVYQGHTQQLKPLLPKYNLQQLKQKYVLQSIPPQVLVPTHEQMMSYLQQLPKRSVPDIRPIPHGICSRRLMQFLYHLQQRPSDNNITYWRMFAAEYYALRGKKRWCLSLYNGVGERSLGVFSHFAMECWHCDMCASKPGKGFEANFEILPRLYKTYFDSGVLDELLFLDLPHEDVLPSGLILLRYEKAIQETIYEKFRVVREGQLRIVFQNDLKILAWEFCARCHDEVVPRSLVAPQVNELVLAAQQCQGKGGSSGTAVKKLQSTCKMFVAAEGQLTRNLDLVLVNDLGFPKRYIRCLQIADIMDSMKDLMTFSLDNNVGPIESLTRYSRDGTIDNTQQQTGISAASAPVLNRSKQAVYGGMSSHQMMQISTSNSKKQKPSDSVNYLNQKVYYSPLLDPRSSCQSQVQRSPVSCTSSSTFAEFDDKLQEQKIDKILQQMESNTRGKTDPSKNVKAKVRDIGSSDGIPTAADGSPTADATGNGRDPVKTNTAVWKSATNYGIIRGDSSSVKVKEEVIEEPSIGLTTDLASKIVGRGRIENGTDVGNTSTAAWKAVPRYESKMRDSSETASSSNPVKQEPDVEDIYKGLYLPEAIMDVDREFFRLGALDDVCKGWKGIN